MRLEWTKVLNNAGAQVCEAIRKCESAALAHLFNLEYLSIATQATP